MAKMDETEYLLSYEANAEHLRLSIEQAKRGEVTKVSIADFYIRLPRHVKDGIEKSRKQAEAGKVIPLEEVIERLNKR